MRALKLIIIVGLLTGFSTSCSHMHKKECCKSKTEKCKDKKNCEAKKKKCGDCEKGTCKKKNCDMKKKEEKKK